MKERPERIRIGTELGMRQTPPGGPEQYIRQGLGAHVLLMGIGPEPADVAALLPEGKAVYAMEAPQFKAQMPASWHAALPGHWKCIDPGDLDEFIMAGAELWVYRPAVRFFPSFWGPLLGRCRWLKLAAAASPPVAERTVLLPGSENDLLVREMAAAFQAAGLAVRTLPPDRAGELVPALLREHKPAFFFSINFKGLDAYGEIFNLLHAARVPVCVWCVDNPFHLVSGLRSPFWTEARLALTDASFAPTLKLHGARDVLHLPLAAWPELFNAAPPEGETDLGLGGRMAFVGRSQFPGKAQFFAGCSVPRRQWDAAQALLEQGGRPDFRWWEQRLDIWPLWPGNEVRRIGCGAEAASRNHRAACLAAAMETGLTVFGDSGWQELLPPQADLRPPVDYYATLPAIYRQAAWTLNVTSLLLPEGLTQRHFDVWAAGGLLLTDDTPGLALFPADLTREIRFTKPEELPALARRLAPGSALRRDLQAAWQDEILARHTYANRAATLLDWIGV